MEESKLKASLDWCDVITHLTLNYQRKLKRQKKQDECNVVAFPAKVVISNDDIKKTSVLRLG